MKFRKLHLPHLPKRDPRTDEQKAADFSAKLQAAVAQIRADFEETREVRMREYRESFDAVKQALRSSDHVSPFVD